MNQRSKFLSILFDQGESICSGNMYSIEVQPQSSAIGPYISINPLTNRRLDSNVTAFRNFLIEMDQPGLSMDAQLEIARDAGLPYSTATWSGSKSIHFIVSLVEPVDEKTWRRWAAALIKALPGADVSTKNPSRFTRLPNHFRSDTQQVQQLIEATGRLDNASVARYIEPHLEPETTDYRKAYNNFRGLTGVAAAHPMTKAFIAGTHPCMHGRNNALYKSVKDLADCNVDPATIAELLTSAALETGLTLREVTQTIRSALSK